MEMKVSVLTKPTLSDYNSAMKYLIWDFDGTLGYRDGGAWTASLLEVLDRELPGHTITSDMLEPYTRAGFPWQEWEQPHLHLNDAQVWWNALLPLFETAYEGVGYPASQAQALARQFREVYLDLDRWRHFDDVIPTLETLSSQGWTHVILSNHVPELNDIMQYIGLKPYFAHIFNSAKIGYEKPHPEIFRIALDTLSDADAYNADALWMIGDNFHADIQGAQAAGIPGILVRRHHPDAEHFCENLDGIRAIVNSHKEL
jgi:putative hydrolase of the HAD superfamily